MGLDDDLVPAEPTPDELRLGARIASLAQDPSDEARARIMAAVRSAPLPSTVPHRRFRVGGRWRLPLIGFGATALLLSASAGALAASADALPTNPAYGLRRFEENLRVAVANPSQKPRLHLQFAAEKLRQAKAQIRLGGVSNAAKLVNDSKQDLENVQAELQNIHDPSELRDLAGEDARLQADAVNQQDQVETIVKGGEPVPPLSRPTPGDGSSVPAPEGTVASPTNPAASPNDNSEGSPDATPVP